VRVHVEKSEKQSLRWRLSGQKKVKAARRASWGVLERAPFSAGGYSGFLLDDLGNPT
jgi:hypothetical protein